MTFSLSPADPSLAREASAQTGYAERIAFVVEVAQRLHAYGTTAQRLEGAVLAVAHRLGLECEPWSNPTGMILSFSDPSRPGGVSDVTRVIRLAPGETDLYKLCEADRITEDVTAGRVGIAEGRAQLRALDRPLGMHGRMLQVFGFGLASAAVAGLLRLLFDHDTSEQLFPFVLLALALPIAMLIKRKTRRFAQFMFVGMVVTALVVGGVASLVLYFMADA